MITTKVFALLAVLALSPFSLAAPTGTNSTTSQEKPALAKRGTGGAILAVNCLRTSGQQSSEIWRLWDGNIVEKYYITPAWYRRWEPERIPQYPGDPAWKDVQITEYGLNTPPTALRITQDATGSYNGKYDDIPQWRWVGDAYVGDLGDGRGSPRPLFKAGYFWNQGTIQCKVLYQTKDW